MHPRAEEFARIAADRHGIEIDVHEFDEGTKTAADAAEVVGCDVAQIASGLVFAADGDPIMVVTSGASRVDEGHLADEIGASEAAMADPNLVREATGYGIGGVPRSVTRRTCRRTSTRRCSITRRCRRPRAHHRRCSQSIPAVSSNSPTRCRSR